MWAEKHGKTWRIRDRIAGEVVTVQSGYASKTAAKTAIVTAQADRMRGDALVPRGGRVLLADWIDAWLPTYEGGLKPSSAQSEPARVRNHILPLLGRYALEELEQPLVVQRWLADLTAGRGPMAEAVAGKRRRQAERRKLSPKTVRNVHAILHKILAAAVAHKLIRSNPCLITAKSLPERVHHEMRFLTEPEIGRLLAAVPKHWRPLVLLLVGTGLRWGEAVGLRVGRVDLLAKPPRLTVLQAMHELSGTGEIIYTTPKTAASRRTVTFTVQIAMTLTPLWSGRDRAELLFTASQGGPVRIRNFRRGWVQWTRAAGLAGLRIHDLRHTHAAILISDGVPLTGVQRRVGHSSIAVTSDLYGHLMPAVDEGILTAIDAALAAVNLDELDAEISDELAEI